MFNDDGNVRHSTLSYLNTVTDYIKEIVLYKSGKVRVRYDSVCDDTNAHIRMHASVPVNGVLPLLKHQFALR